MYSICLYFCKESETFKREAKDTKGTIKFKGRKPDTAMAKNKTRRED